MVERLEQIERPRAVAVDGEREDLVVVGIERRQRRAGDARRIDGKAMRREAEAGEPIGGRGLVDQLEFARVRAVGAELHQRRKRVREAGGRDRGGRIVARPMAVRRRREATFVDQAEHGARRRVEHRHVVGHRDREDAGAAGRRVAEVVGADLVLVAHREVEHQVIERAGRIDVDQRAARRDVDRRRAVVALRVARVGGPVNSRGDALVAHREQIEARRVGAGARDHESLAVGNMVVADTQALRRHLDGGARIVRRVGVAGEGQPVEGHPAGRQLRVVSGRQRELRRHRAGQVVQRDCVAVEVDRLHEAREVDGRRILAVADRLIERLQQVERPRAVAVDGQRENLVVVRVERRERVAVDGRRIDQEAVRGEPESREPGAGCRRVDHMECGGVWAVGAELDERCKRAGGAGRGGRKALIVADAVGVGRRREAAFIDGGGDGGRRRVLHRHVVGVGDREGAAGRVAVEVLRRVLEGEVELVLARDRLVERLVEHEVVAAVRRGGRQRDREHDVRGIDRGRRGCARIADQGVGVEERVLDRRAVRGEVGDQVVAGVVDHDVVCRGRLVGEEDGPVGRDRRDGAEVEVVDDDAAVEAVGLLELERADLQALEHRAGGVEHE